MYLNGYLNLQYIYVLYLTDYFALDSRNRVWLVV